MMHAFRVFTICCFILACLGACDAHDYWLLENKITVDSDKEFFFAINETPIEQDLFVRYQVDYTIQNLSDTKATEVVVAATSYVNGTERATGRRVWHLEPSEMGSGMITTAELELGNSLMISLGCCGTTKCSRSEVICPQDPTGISENQIASFCYENCQYGEVFKLICPAESACAEACADLIDIDKDGYEVCRVLSCGDASTAQTCYDVCEGDLDCVEGCEPAQECVRQRNAAGATCFRNCLAVWNQCTQTTYVPPEDQMIPCSLCGGSGECYVNKKFMGTDVFELTSKDGQTIKCEKLECSSYPPECMSDCRNLYDTDDARIGCLESCLEQHMFWCNDYAMPLDYVDSRVKQPCCFEPYCNNALETVIKTYKVECFNDTSCGSGYYCSNEGVCVASDMVSNCSMSANRRGSWTVVLLLFGVLVALRRRRHA